MPRSWRACNAEPVKGSGRGTHPGPGVDLQAAALAAGQELVAETGDHRRVVGAQCQAGVHGTHRRFVQAFAQVAVGGHPAGGDHAVDAGLAAGQQCLVQHDVDGGLLERGGEVGGGLRIGGIAELLPLVDDRRLEPRIGDVEAVVSLVQRRPREAVGRGITVGGEALDGDAAGIAHGEVLGHLVERLAAGVVDGGAQHLDAVEAVDPSDQGVSARQQ